MQESSRENLAFIWMKGHVDQVVERPEKYSLYARVEARHMASVLAWRTRLSTRRGAFLHFVRTMIAWGK